MRLEVSRLPRATPLGFRTGLIGLGLLAAGFNTGNNLFYLIFTVLASAELLGFLAAGRVLRRARIGLAVPRRGRSGTALRASLRVENASAWLPLPALAWRLVWREGPPTRLRTPAAPAGGVATGVAAWAPPRRGWHDLVAVEVGTDFPLGLSGRIARLRRPNVRILAWPHPAAGTSTASRRRAGDTRRAANPRGSGEDPLDAREYRPGDDARRIDWKASARTERLIWRDRRAEPPRAIEVRLDRSGGPGELFERRVSAAAGAVSDALGRGLRVGFRSDQVDFAPDAGPKHRRRILEYLATVRPADAEAGP